MRYTPYILVTYTNICIHVLYIHIGHAAIGVYDTRMQGV